MSSTPVPGARGRDIALAHALDEVRARCDVEIRRQRDPVDFVHRYAAPADRELVGLLASSLAFGNVKALRAKIDDALTRLGPRVADMADDADGLRRRLDGFQHRMCRGSDVAALLIGARRVQRRAGSLGEHLRAELAHRGTLREALSAWVRAIRESGGLDACDSERRGAMHILVDPARGSAAKRLMLLLRWMVRPADGVDLGLWAIPPSILVIPLDTHIHKLSRNLGLTARRDVSFRTAEEVTMALRRLDPDDPVKYDFSLCHLGMVQGCPSRRDPARCAGCGVQPVCRHWAPRRADGRRKPVGEATARAALRASIVRTSP